MIQRRIVKIVALGVAAGAVTVSLKANQWDINAIGLLRFGRAACTVLSIAADYRSTLYKGEHDVKSDEYVTLRSSVHKRSAEKLLELCCINRGVFIKVGQHVGALDYLLPPEYVETMRILHSHAPESTLDEIKMVLKQDLKQELCELFVEFDPKPLGAASLAQVHKATLKDGTVVAVKVQHPYVRSNATVDMKTMEVLANCIAWVFPDFKFKWLVDETKRNIPLELDFKCEARNAERVATMFRHFPWLKVPKIYWNLTTSRVLTMEFCEGGSVNNLEYITDMGLSPQTVSQRLGELYADMIFVHGYVHSDPHPGNVLVQPGKNGPVIVLLDHGLYATLSDTFRWQYARLWLSLLSADMNGIKTAAKELGVGELYGIFACMVTGRSWGAITKGISKKISSKSERSEIQQYAAQYLPQISDVLSRVDRQMLLLFKTNDLLRSIEYSLRTQNSRKSFITMSKSCLSSVYNEQLRMCSSVMCRVCVQVSCSWQMFKIRVFEFYLWIKWSPVLSWSQVQ